MSDLSTIRFHANEGRLVRAVAKSERLSGLLPQEELAPLVTAYHAATKTAAEAAKIEVEEIDVFAMLDEKFRAGETVDPKALVAKLADAQAKRDQRDRTVRALSAIPANYASDIVRLVNENVTAMYDDLSAQLEEVLDEAEAVLRDLGEVTTADEAIEAGKAEQWSRFRALGRTYADIRAAHLELLNAEATGSFAPGSVSVGYAFYLGLDDVLPNYARVMTHGTSHPDPRYVGLRTEGLAFAVNDPTDLGHWLATVRDRARLQPIVEFADDARNRAREANARLHAEMNPTPGQPTRSRMVRENGGELGAMENSYTARRIRAHAPTQRRREAELDA